MFQRLQQNLHRRLERLLDGRTPTIQPAPPQAEVETLRARGNACIQSGDLAQAEAWFRKALQINADDTNVLVCLGYVLKEQGQNTEARVLLSKATRTASPGFEIHEAYYVIGQISVQQGDLDDAKMQFTKALELRADFTYACRDLCQIYQQQGDPAAVRRILGRCVDLEPNVLEYRLWLADVCLSAVEYDRVIEHLSAALRLGGGALSAACMKLGVAYCRTGQIAQGRELLLQAETLDPSLAYVTQYELGTYYVAAGELELGLEHIERCIELKPDFLAAHSTALTTLSHARARNTGDYERAASRFAAVARAQIGWVAGPRVAGRQHEHLRIGFVSGDLRKHPVAYFLIDVLRNFDREGVRLLAYSNNEVDDEVTRSLQAIFDEWHQISNMSDDVAAELIFDHQVDLLIDLGGHTGDNRLGIFVRRPAPRQISWLGYWASTGLKEIDYFLADSLSAPEASTEWFAEQVYRLPRTRMCLTIPNPSRPIPVSPPPCLSKGYTTFGSFQQVSKMTPQVLALWAQILEAVPGSQLRLQSRALMANAVRERLQQSICTAGIDLSRVQLVAGVELEEYLEAHREIDILLDTFPYPGGTTTAFALWMGVPTITMDGDTVIARQGAALMSCVGLHDWIAATEGQYLDLARRKSADLSGLKTLRDELRRKAEASPYFDARSFARDLRNAFIALSRDAP